MKDYPNYSWLEVSRKALLNNISVHRSFLGGQAKLMAVVKSNAYGHGLVLAAKVGESSGKIDWLGVASLAEAFSLRAAKINLPILVLSYYQPLRQFDLQKAIKQKISFVVYEQSALLALSKAGQQVKKPARVHLKIDTGMARLGLRDKQAYDFLKQIRNSLWLKLEGVASHLATAESKQSGFLLEQLGNFSAFLEKGQAWLPDKYYRHIACTAALNSFKNSHYDLGRLGIGYYGLWPSAENKLVVNKFKPKIRLQPALTWKTFIIELQKLPKGATVGYGRTYTTKQAITMAVLPVGYWDGYRRSLSNKGEVIIQGQLCPVIGRVCMNITMVDVTKLAKVRVNDEVVLLGCQGKKQITAEQIGIKSGTINYEVITAINPLLPRVLVK
ncbi:alanine racemase [Patescibacteria group bacterium]|nr:alanine racemase [Patescibacteria group bacterium]